MWDFFTPDERKRIGDAVDSAPSVFDERPWFLRIIADDRVELHLDYPERDLSLLPREVAISCGAALYNLRLAIRVAGHAVSEWLVPDLTRDSTLLASVEITTSRTAPPTDAEQELYEAIAYRRTSTLPYTLIPVPTPLLVEMEEAAASEDGWLRALHPKEAKRLLRATARADRVLADGAVKVPAERTVPPDEAAFDARFDGGPSGGHNAGEDHKSRFPLRLNQDPATSFEGVHKVQLMALSTDDDRPLDWVRAGRALQHALLTATRFSMSAPYGRSARYSAPRQLGLPARRAPIRASHQVPARYGVTTSLLTGLLELGDLQGTARRWPWRSYFPEIPQAVFRVGYSPLEQAPPRVLRPLRWDDRRTAPPEGQSQGGQPPEGQRPEADQAEAD